MARQSTSLLNDHISDFCSNGVNACNTDPAGFVKQPSGPMNHEHGFKMPSLRHPLSIIYEPRLVTSVKCYEHQSFNLFGSAIMAGHLTQYKIAMLGDNGVGKHCFVTRVRTTSPSIVVRGLSLTFWQFVTRYHIEEYDPTLEENVRRQMLVDDDACMVNILDAAASPEYVRLREFTYRDNEAFILAYSITNRESFNSAESYWWPEMLHAKGQKLDMQGWSPRMARAAEFSSKDPETAYIAAALDDARPMGVVVGCKSDLMDAREVSHNEGKAMAQRLGCPFFEVSSKNGSNIDESVAELVRLLRREHKEVKLRREEKVKGKLKSDGEAPLAAAYHVDSQSKFKQMIERVFGPRKVA